MTIEILKDTEIFKSFECEESESANLLKRARGRAEMLTRDNDGDFTARVKPEEVPEEEVAE